ncbi:E3 ubiquitin-protein ligase RNF38-like [Xenia sp. Carnegie-2017]|uniref:E3 ubiquitin-protein ligase RNF38-like n=1 Tax=Xenia sp. Carnegie-2017 TaxID=2897299 RepID=UPI001F03E3A6|nr:E3 ubiquitin-protein ligase RNF38-like [Xenia sp. Carnegie-2017]XP_046850271.1 E3 ubiquitin-protein ligase RNF38-like [Xenia sp. Carnegie-2017]
MANSSSGAGYFPTCPECAKMDLKLYHCPALVGRAHHHHHYGSLGLHNMHPQTLSHPNNQCCPTPHQTLYPSIPLRLHSVCNCSRCRQTDMDRHFPMTSPQIPLSACWMNPMDMHNTNLNSNFVPNPLPSRPCIPPRHVGMSPVTRTESLPLHVDGASGISYNHHHHFHHYHYHTQSRNNLHPYAVPMLHPRFRRRRSPRPSEGNMENANFIPAVITSEAGMTWGGHLNTENLGQLAVSEKPKGISKSVLESLPTYKITSKDKDLRESRCVVCLMDFELKQQLRILPCLHEFHSKCIDKWLKNNRSCPICRKEVKLK